MVYRGGCGSAWMMSAHPLSDRDAGGSEMATVDKTNPRSERPPASPFQQGSANNAILDRIIHNAHRLQLSGDSLRKQNAPKITDA